jgi:hypothetical protein
VTHRTEIRRRVAAGAVGLSLVSCSAVVSFDGYEASRVPPRPISVRVSTFDDVVVTDATVVFHDFDGAVLDVKRSGSDGRAVSRTPAKQVTVALQSGGNYPRLVLTTVAGVEAGDELTVVGSESDTPDPPVAHVTVRVPPLANADRYDVGTVRATIKSKTPDAIAIPVFGGDLDAQSTFALVARGHTPLGDRYLADRHVRLTQGGPTFFEWNGPWLEGERIAVAVKHSAQDRGPGHQDSDGVAVSVLVGEREAFRAIMDSSPDYVAIPPGLADDLVVFGFANLTIDDHIFNRWLVAERGHVSSAFSVDLSALPAVSAHIDVTTPQQLVVQWSATHDGIVGVQAMVHTSLGATAFPYVSWTFIAPPAQREARAPQLPPELAAQLPTTWSAPGHFGLLSVEVTDGDAVPDFAAYKRITALKGDAVPIRGHVRRSTYVESF